MYSVHFVSPTLDQFLSLSLPLTFQVPLRDNRSTPAWNFKLHDFDQRNPPSACRRHLASLAFQIKHQASSLELEVGYVSETSHKNFPLPVFVLCFYHVLFHLSTNLTSGQFWSRCALSTNSATLPSFDSLGRPWSLAKGSPDDTRAPKEGARLPVQAFWRQTCLSGLSALNCFLLKFAAKKAKKLVPCNTNGLGFFLLSANCVFPSTRGGA